jgi:two-component system torCAD operon response regulator TorR
MVTHRQFVSDTRTIDVLVGRIRKKIEPDPGQPDFIITVHGEGYIFIADETN